MSTRRLALAGTAILLGALMGQAQDKASSNEGGFENSGSVTAGYRFTDVSGRDQKYLELFDLRKGPRLTEFDLFGKSSENNVADSYSINMSGLGGDPYPGGQLNVSKTGLYDFRVNYRQSYYYWNRNDDQPNPGALPGLFLNHDWATVRKFGSMFFNLHATKRLRFTFEVNKNSRAGTTFVTRTLEYFGSPSAWGSFTRANPYYLEAPVNENANRFAAGLSYNWRDWNISYKAGYQQFSQNLLIDNVASPQRSIALGDPVTAGELLQNASFNQYRQLNTPVSEFSYVGRAQSRVQVRGDWIFYRYRGPVSQNAGFNGTARITGTTLGAYSVSETDRAQVSEPNNVIDQGFTFKISSAWRALVDYRYARFTENGVLQADSLRDSAIATAGIVDSTWRYGQNQFNVQLEFAPGHKLLVRPGIQYIKRDVTVLDGDLVDLTRTKRSKFVAPILSLYYTPGERFTIRGSVQSITNGTPYTRISPRTDVVRRWTARYRANDRVTIENSAIFRTGKYDVTNFRSSTSQDTTVISYALNDRFSIFGGFGYESFLATDSVTFLRGTPPLDAIWRDQTVNRIWQAGIDARPTKRLTMRISGNYDRTTGVGEISGEPPLQGPIRFPLATGTVSYDFGKPGRFSVDLQRTYYIEEILPGDNFNASILELRWTKNF